MDCQTDCHQPIGADWSEGRFATFQPSVSWVDHVDRREFVPIPTPLDRLVSGAERYKRVRGRRPTPETFEYSRSTVRASDPELDSGGCRPVARADRARLFGCFLVGCPGWRGPADIGAGRLLNLDEKSGHSIAQSDAAHRHNFGGHTIVAVRRHCEFGATRRPSICGTIGPTGRLRRTPRPYVAGASRRCCRRCLERRGFRAARLGVPDLCTAKASAGARLSSARSPEWTHPMSVAAVTVSYGSRQDVLTTTVAKALAAGVDVVIVIDNGCSETARAALRNCFGQDERVRLSAPAPNRGSAVGFGDGIAVALQQDVEFIWLLDDDNWVDADALAALKSRARSLPVGSALCSYRVHDALHARVAEGYLVDDAYPSPGDFFGIDVLRSLTQRLSPNRSAAVGPPGDDGAVDVPFAPYGGFFAASATFRIMGLPDPTFYLYEDDTDYTERVPRGGGTISLVFNSSIRDADAKWSDGEEQSGIARLLGARDSNRMIYAVRNRSRVDIARARRANRRVRVALNFGAFSAAVLIRGVQTGRLRRSLVMLRSMFLGARKR